MDCLTNYIGLSGCGSTVPDSGLYINDLAGIELKQIDEIANAEDQNYVGVWTKVKKRALKKFESDVKKAFRVKHKIKGLTQSLNFGKEIDLATTRGAAAEYRGIVIELNEDNEELIDSNLQVIHVENIKIYVPGALTFDLVAYDLDTDEELYNESQTTTASGWLTVNINQDFLNSRRIIFGYECTAIDSVKLDIEDAEVNCFEKCRSRVRGAYSDIATPTDYTLTEYNAHGLSITFSIQCKFDVVICNNKDVFAQSLLYLLGSELMFEAMNSSRTTRWTLLDHKQTKYLHGYYRALYLGGIFDEQQFEGELNEAVNTITLDQYDCCVECSGPLRFQNAYI